MITVNKISDELRYDGVNDLVFPTPNKNASHVMDASLTLELSASASATKNYVLNVLLFLILTKYMCDMFTCFLISKNIYLGA